MITRVEARGYRCLRYLSQPLGPFHVLVGPNGSGKTTFLDVVAFMGDLVSSDVEEAVHRRTDNFLDLVWQRTGEGFELAIEAAIPTTLRQALSERSWSTIRYEVAPGLNPETGEIELRFETLMLLPDEQQSRSGDSGRIIIGPDDPPSRTVAYKASNGQGNFYVESGETKSAETWIPAFNLGTRRSALANLPEDESKFPIATWLKALLSEGVHQLILNSLRLRQASRSGQGLSFRPDGSNLPWVVEDLKQKSPARFGEWLEHLRTSLPDLESIRTVERPDDRHRYLMLGYRGGVEVPSWTASDGTLRLLALTLPAYVEGLEGIYLIEEPENGVHPRAVETMYQSLSSVYDAQILLATHSPVLLGLVELDQLLCFSKNEEGATEIVLGNDHPFLEGWRGETSLGTLFASGVLGYGE